MSNNETNPNLQGAEEPETFLLSESARAKIDEWLAGIEATRNGVFDVFFIEKNDHSGITVTPENADELEAEIRDCFGPHYPELIRPTDEL
jgi:hypothetical protein